MLRQLKLSRLQIMVAQFAAAGGLKNSRTERVFNQYKKKMPRRPQAALMTWPGMSSCLHRKGRY